MDGANVCNVISLLKKNSFKTVNNTNSIHLYKYSIEIVYSLKYI